MYEWAAIGIGCLVTALLLVICHILCWGKGEAIAAYTIGTACLMTGLTVTGVILQDVRLSIAPWIFAFVGGGTVVLCWQIRGWLQDWKRRDRLADSVVERVRNGTARKP